MSLPNGKYIVTSYFQKSLNLLFPIISKQEQIGVINTYLFGDYVKEDIVDYFLICEMERNVDLNEHLQKLLYASYDVENESDVELCIFNVSEYKEEIATFLAGSYSEYTKATKDVILKYHHWEYTNPSTKKLELIPISLVKKMPSVAAHFYVFLYPFEFKKEVAVEMTDGFKLYNSKEECLRVLNEIKEFAPIYDVERETFKKRIL